MNYTIINHALQKTLNVTDSEYCVLDLIYRLSTNPEAPVEGWCTMSKPNQAEWLNTSKRTLGRNYKKLHDKGLIDRSQDGRMVKTTTKYQSKRYAIESANVADSRPMWPTPSANVADGIKVDSKNNISVSVYTREENSFKKILGRFSKLNLKHKSAAFEIFRINHASGKYGNPNEMKNRQVLERFESFMICYDANHRNDASVQEKVDMLSKSKEVDLSNPGMYQ